MPRRMGCVRIRVADKFMDREAKSPPHLSLRWNRCGGPGSACSESQIDPRKYGGNRVAPLDVGSKPIAIYLSSRPYNASSSFKGAKVHRYGTVVLRIAQCHAPDAKMFFTILTGRHQTISDDGSPESSRLLQFASCKQLLHVALSAKDVSLRLDVSKAANPAMHACMPHVTGTHRNRYFIGILLIQLCSQLW